MGEPLYVTLDFILIFKNISSLKFLFRWTEREKHIFMIVNIYNYEWGNSKQRLKLFIYLSKHWTNNNTYILLQDCMLLILYIQLKQIKTNYPYRDSKTYIKNSEVIGNNLTNTKKLSHPFLQIMEFYNEIFFKNNTT